MNCASWAEKLDAYVDGEMPAGDSLAVDEHLRICPECANEVLSRMQIKRATRAAAAMRFTPPPDLRRRVAKSIAPSRPRFAFWMNPALAAAVVLAVVVALSSALFVRHAQREQALAQLLDMHVSTLASPNPVDVVSSDRHTVKPWFQGKLPFTFTLPELAASQFTLNGGKLVYFRGRPAAQLIYQLRKHQFSVFIVQNGGPGFGGVSTETAKGFSTESWTSAGLHYVVMSDAGAPDVHALADLLRSVQH